MEVLETRSRHSVLRKPKCLRGIYAATDRLKAKSHHFNGGFANYVINTWCAN